MTAVTKTTRLLYFVSEILHKENKVLIYAFIHPGSSLTILLSKTAHELRLPEVKRQKLVLEGANRHKDKLHNTKNCDFRRRRKLQPQRFILEIKILPELKQHPGYIVKKLLSQSRQNANSV